MLKLRSDVRYVDEAGKLTQAGVEAFQGQIDGQASSASAQIAALDTRLDAVETELAGSLVNLQTAQTASSNTEFNFTGIPSWVNRITMQGFGLSTSGTSAYILRVGDGAIVATGYIGATTRTSGGVSTTTATTGCGIATGVSASTTIRFVCTINRVSGNNWAFSGTGSFATAEALFFASEITLTGALDRVRLTTVGGTDTFDAGSVSISWE